MMGSGVFSGGLRVAWSEPHEPSLGMEESDVQA
jgi:hypothetical protein